MPNADDQRHLPVEMVMVERMTRVETKLDAVLESKRVDHAEMAKDIADHETRIRDLERVWWKTTGLAAGVSAVITAIGAVLVKILFGV